MVPWFLLILMNIVYSFKCKTIADQKFDAPHFITGEKTEILCNDPHTVTMMIEYDFLYFTQIDYNLDKTQPFVQPEHIYFYVDKDKKKDGSKMIEKGQTFLEIVIGEGTDYKQYEQKPITLNSKAKLVKTNGETLTEDGGTAFVTTDASKVASTRTNSSRPNQISLSPTEVKGIIQYQKMLKDIKAAQKEHRIYEVDYMHDFIYGFNPWFTRNGQWMRIYVKKDKNADTATTSVRYWRNNYFNVKKLLNAQTYKYEFATLATNPAKFIMTLKPDGYDITHKGKSYSLFWEPQQGGWCGKHAINNFIRATNPKSKLTTCKELDLIGEELDKKIDPTLECWCDEPAHKVTSTNGMMVCTIGAALERRGHMLVSLEYFQGTLFPKAFDIVRVLNALKQNSRRKKYEGIIFKQVGHWTAVGVNLFGSDGYYTDFNSQSFHSMGPNSQPSSKKKSFSQIFNKGVEEVIVIFTQGEKIKIGDVEKACKDVVVDLYEFKTGDNSAELELYDYYDYYDHYGWVNEENNLDSFVEVYGPAFLFLFVGFGVLVVSAMCCMSGICMGVLFSHVTSKLNS